MGNQSHCARTRLSSSNMRAFFVGAAIVGAASASELKLTWADCGDSSTHTDITSFTPSTITTGRKATMIGTGNLDEDVSGATFDLEMKTAAGTVSCKGDASQSKTCNLPLGTGSLTFDAMAFPIKKGSTAISVDLSLAAALPGALAHTDTTVTAKGSNGDDLFCMEIKSAPAQSDAFDDFTKRFGRKYASDDEQEYRKAVFNKNLEWINAENAKGKSHTVG